MAASGAPERQPRRGPAPIASFDHDVSDESSPETKQTFRLPEIREDRSCVSGGVGDSLAPPEQRARSHSTPAVAALGTAAAPRIDISRASSSSHQDSRDSSPELALFAGGGGADARARLELGFREDGALDLRSSTEELAFLEGAPGEPRATQPPPPPPAERRHSRKDSQGSEAALLAVSGRTSRLSSVGSQCSAHSALSGLSRASRLSVVSGVSRSPSPHRMLLETSFCGPRPIETDPEICAAAVEERLMEMAKLSEPPPPPPPPVTVTVTVDARDRREVRTEATVESGSARLTSPAAPVVPVISTPVAPPPTPVVKSTTPVSPPNATAEPEKIRKETDNRARVEERRARPRLRREPSEPEVYKSGNRTKNVIRIKLKPDEDYGEEEEEVKSSPPADLERLNPLNEPAPVPGTSARASRPTELVGRTPTSPLQQRRRISRESRTPSPSGAPVSRKSSFCSLFKSRETIASPDSPSEALRRKRSLTEGRSRSKSRDRSVTPNSTNKIRGSVLSLFRTPRKSATSPSPSSREGSPVVQVQRSLAPTTPLERARPGEKLKYYEDARNGIIHIPLHTPPDEKPDSEARRVSAASAAAAEPRDHERDPPRPASAPTTRPAAEITCTRAASKPIQRTVLPDGSIIIPLRSPTERVADVEFPQSTACDPEPTLSRIESEPVAVPPEGRDEADGAEASPVRERLTQNITEHPREETEMTPSGEDDRKKRKQRMTFTTHVGSREQVFSTQFSITKTPSVTSEFSGTFPAFGDGEETPLSTKDAADTDDKEAVGAGGAPDASETTRDSSESEPSSEAAAPRNGSEVERRGLVVQESFEEELPYVPTTLPLERPVALPMVPVRERGGVRVSAVERPRAAPPPAPRPRAPRPAPAAPDGPAHSADKLRIRLPRRARPASATPTARTSRARTRSGGDGAESRPKEWIDFEEVPERRKQPKRIQTLPGGAAGMSTAGVSGVAGVAGLAGAAGPAGVAPGGGVVFSYVEPEHCRCECHAHTRLASHHSPESPTEESPLDAHELQAGAAFSGEADGAAESPGPDASRDHAFN